MRIRSSDIPYSVFLKSRKKQLRQNMHSLNIQPKHVKLLLQIRIVKPAVHSITRVINQHVDILVFDLIV